MLGWDEPGGGEEEEDQDQDWGRNMGGYGDGVVEARANERQAAMEVLMLAGEGGLEGLQVCRDEVREGRL